MTFGRSTTSPISKGEVQALHKRLEDQGKELAKMKMLLAAREENPKKDGASEGIAEIKLILEKQGEHMGRLMERFEKSLNMLDQRVTTHDATIKAIQTDCTNFAQYVNESFKAMKESMEAFQQKGREEADEFLKRRMQDMEKQFLTTRVQIDQGAGQALESMIQSKVQDELRKEGAPQKVEGTVRHVLQKELQKYGGDKRKAETLESNVMSGSQGHSVILRTPKGWFPAAAARSSVLRALYVNEHLFGRLDMGPGCLSKPEATGVRAIKQEEAYELHQVFMVTEWQVERVLKFKGQLKAIAKNVFLQFDRTKEERLVKRDMDREIQEFVGQQDDHDKWSVVWVEKLKALAYGPGQQKPRVFKRSVGVGEGEKEQGGADGVKGGDGKGKKAGAVEPTSGSKGGDPKGKKAAISGATPTPRVREGGYKGRSVAGAGPSRVDK